MKLDFFGRRGQKLGRCIQESAKADMISKRPKQLRIDVQKSNIWEYPSRLGECMGGCEGPLKLQEEFLL